MKKPEMNKKYQRQYANTGTKAKQPIDETESREKVLLPAAANNLNRCCFGH